MKKHLIYFVLISICIGCNNLQQEDEVISPSEKLQTKTSDHNKHLVTITTNLNEELILFQPSTPPMEYQGMKKSFSGIDMLIP